MMSEAVSRNLTSWPGDMTAEDARGRIAEVMGGMARGTGLELAIIRGADDRLLGWIGFDLIDPDRGTARLGFWLGAPYHGQGYMTEAVPAAIRHACAALRVRLLEACVLPHNEISLRLLAKLGFRHAGEEEIYSPVRGRSETYRRLALPVGGLGEGWKAMA
jgi:ribosomal-protein-alanine N-acetyltransferase